MLEVGTQSRPRSNWAASTARSRRAGGHRRQRRIPVHARRRAGAPAPSGTGRARRRRRRAVARSRGAPTRLERARVGHQHLAAPDRAVGAVAGAVEREADHRPVRPAVARPCRTRCGRGGAAPATTGRPRRVPAAHRALTVARVPVGRQQLRPDAAERLQMPLGGGERLPGGQVVHVADVPGQPGVTPLGQAAGVLQVRADRQHRRHRRPAARPAAARTRGTGGPAVPRRRPPGSPSRRRARGSAGRASSQPSARPPAGPAPPRRRSRSARRRGCRLVITSAGARGRRQPKQVVQRACTASMTPRSGLPGATCSASRAGSRRAAARSAGAGRSAALRVGSSSSASRRGASRSATITANGLSPRSLRLRRLATAASLRGVAGQVVAADALHGEDRALVEQLPRAPQRRLARSAPSSSRSVGPQSGQAIGWAWKRRSAGSAYSAAHRAHIAEPGHGGGRPVVGQAGDDGEPRAAVGAGDERVAGTAGRPGRRVRPGSRRRWPGRARRRSAPGRSRWPRC